MSAGSRSANSHPGADTVPPSPSTMLWVMPLFFLSGATSLTLENLWTRALTLIFGSSTFAMSTVLATFMGGLALGSLAAGRWVDRAQRPGHLLAAYGILEGIVGLYGLMLPWIIGLAERFNIFVWTQWQPGFYSFSLLRFALTAVLLIVPTTCMGATLPVLSRFVCHVRTELGRQAGTLYAVNTFGAMTGAFTAGFILMPMAGLSRTNLLACGTDILICFAAVALARYLPSTGLAEETQETGSHGTVASPLRLLKARVAFWSIGISGAVAMVYQVAWTRTLSLVLGSSVYAFTLILICFLFGLAAGGALYARRTATQPGQTGNLSVVHLCIAATAFLGLILTDRFPPAFLVLVKVLKLSPTGAFVSKFLLSAALMLLPTFFMGMIFPATVRLAADTGKTLGWTVGSVYSINTVGAIVGSFAGGFVLIPCLGLQYTQAAMILSNIGLAVVFAGLTTADRTKGLAHRLYALATGRPNNASGGGTRVARITRLAAAFALLIAVAVFYRPWNLSAMTSGVFRVSAYELAKRKPGDKKRKGPGFKPGAHWTHWKKKIRPLTAGLAGVATNTERVVDSRMAFYREGIVTTVSITRSIYEGITRRYCWEGISLLVNGKADASVTGRFRRPADRTCKELIQKPGAFGPPDGISWFGDTETQVMSGLLGVLLSDPQHPPRNALVVGWGSGITVGSLAATPVEKIVAVELEREVVRAARWFERYNHGAARHPKVTLLEGDGRTHIAAARNRYDIIISEPSNPWITGCSNLFTLEYFKMARRRLNPSGKFVQWLQVYEISPRNVSVILATLLRAFPHVRIVRPGFTAADLLLVASNSPLTLDHGRIARWLAHSQVGPEAARIDVRRAEDLLIRFVADGPSLRRKVAGMPVNTDDNALVEFSAPKDLINYHKYNPHRIAASLARGAAPLLPQIRNGPPDLRLQMARAYLSAGRLKRVRALTRNQPGAGIKAVADAARIMGRDRSGRKALTGLSFFERHAGHLSDLTRDPPRKALTRALEHPYLESRPALGFALIGTILWELDRRSDTLRFLWAAHHKAEGPNRRDTATVLASYLHRLGLSRLAVAVLVQNTPGRVPGSGLSGPRPGAPAEFFVDVLLNNKYYPPVINNLRPRGGARR